MIRRARDAVATVAAFALIVWIVKFEARAR